MHQHGYCHRDIKPENILLEHKHARCISSNDIKICDFGQCATGQVDGIKSLSDLCGSPGFFAPEMILDGNLYCGIRADIWSIGCVLLELALGHEHYCHNWMNAYDKEVLQNENVFKDRLTTTLTEINALKFDNDDMGNFLKRLLVINPDDRMRSNNLIHDKWLCGKDRCPSRLYASSSDESTDCADSFKIDTACVLGKKNLEQIKFRDRKSSLFHSSRDSIEARKRCSQRHHKILGRQREICLPPIGELKLNTSNTTK
jgi:serine/threonine protein kinase